MQSLRHFSSSACSRAAKVTKGAKAPVRKKPQRITVKSKKAGDASGGAPASAFASKIKSAKASAALDPQAPRIEMAPITPAAFTSENLGIVLETPNSIVSKLYALDVLERQAGYHLFSQIAMVLREPSLAVSEIIRQDGSSQNRRVLLDGLPGSGKTFTLIQAITLALQNKWIVLAIPRAEALVDSSCAYAYDEKRGAWRQDTYTAQLLHRVAEANKDVLQLQNTSKTFYFDRHTVPERVTLHHLLELGARDPAIAHSVLDAFLSEMNLEGRPPLMLTLDNLSVATVPTQYRDRSFKAIHPFDLDVIKTFVSYLSGSRVLTNGAIITNTSSRPSCVPKALRIALGQAEQSPFDLNDERIAPVLHGVQVIQVKEYNQTEAKSIIKHYASAGLLRGLSAADISDSIVQQRTIMGSAIGREVFRSCLKQV